MVVGEGFDIAIPYRQGKDELRRDIFEVSVMGRLKPGVTMQRASGEMDALSPPFSRLPFRQVALHTRPKLTNISASRPTLPQRASVRDGSMTVRFSC